MYKLNSFFFDPLLLVTKEVHMVHILILWKPPATKTDSDVCIQLPPTITITISLVPHSYFSCHVVIRIQYDARGSLVSIIQVKCNARQVLFYFSHKYVLSLVFIAYLVPLCQSWNDHRLVNSIFGECCWCDSALHTQTNNGIASYASHLIKKDQ